MVDVIVVGITAGTPQRTDTVDIGKIDADTIFDFFKFCGYFFGENLSEL